MIVLALFGAFVLGVLADYWWLERKFARIRFCESCHSDGTENHTAFVDLCTDCYRIYHEHYYGAGRDTGSVSGGN